MRGTFAFFFLGFYRTFPNPSIDNYNDKKNCYGVLHFPNNYNYTITDILFDRIDVTYIIIRENDN